MVRTTYLLGPSSAKQMQPLPGGEAPPADADLLERAARSPGALPARAPHLAGFLADLLGWREGPLPVGFDSLLAFLALERLRRKGHNRETLDRARSEAWKLAIEALAPHIEAPPCPLHVRMLRGLGPEDAVLTLSRPVLLERALEAALGPEEADGWNAAGGYGHAFRKVRQGGSWRDPGPGGRRTIRLLKLRGSFGWLRCRGCRADYAVATEHPHPDDAGFRFPCVHPSSSFEPVWLLAGEGGGGLPALFGRLWTAAARALSGARRLVLIGDPLDVPDRPVEWLLRHALSRRKRPPEVVLVGLGGAPGDGAAVRGLLGGCGIEPRTATLQELAEEAAPGLTLF